MFRHVVNSCSGNECTHSLWHLGVLAVHWVLSHRLKSASGSPARFPLPSLSSLCQTACHRPFCAHCPHVVTSSVLLIPLPAGPDGPWASPAALPTASFWPLPSTQALHPPWASPFSCVSPPRPQPSSWPQGVLCLLLLSPGAPSVRGLLHQSSQSKINEEKPKSQVQGLVKEKKAIKKETKNKEKSSSSASFQSSFSSAPPISVGSLAIPLDAQAEGQHCLRCPHHMPLGGLAASPLLGLSEHLFPCLFSCCCPASGLPHPSPRRLQKLLNGVLCSRRVFSSQIGSNYPVLVRVQPRKQKPL